MVDIDHFKFMNDTYGHATGDRVIVFLASCFCLSKHTQGFDLIARFGGEVFCVVPPNTEMQEDCKNEPVRLKVGMVATTPTSSELLQA